MKIFAAFWMALFCSLPLAAVAPPDAGASPSATAEKETALDRLIAENALPLRFAKGEFSGPGGKRLLADAASAEIVVLGESHGNRETPQLTEALLKELRSRGFGVLAVETGPVAAELLVDLARSEEGLDAFRSFLEEWPLSFAFFWWKEEAEMLRSAVAQGYDVWGLDQEFIGSARFLLQELVNGLDGEAAEQAGEWLQQAREGYRRFVEEGDQSAGFLNAIDPEALDSLRMRLPEPARREKTILAELSASATIYQHFGARRYYLNNRDRIDLMKRHFVEYADRAGGVTAMPKVVMKFGGMHAGRGYSALHQLDVGNQAAELSVARGGHSYHLSLIARRSGEGEDARDWSEQIPYLAAFDAHRPEGQWALYDLTALRPHFAVEAHRQEHPELAEQVFRFDALLVAPRFHAAEAMVPVPF